MFRAILVLAALLAVCAANSSAQALKSQTQCIQCLPYLYQLYSAKPEIRVKLLVGPLALSKPPQTLSSQQIDALLQTAKSGPISVRLFALALLRAGVSDALEPPRSDKLLAIVTDPNQSSDLVVHASDTFYRIVHPAANQAAAGPLRKAFDNALHRQRYDYVAAYATALSRTNANNPGLANDLQLALLKLVKTNAINAIEQTTYAYSKIAGSDPPEKPSSATTWLIEHIINNPHVGRDERAAVAVGLLQRQSLPAADFAALRATLEQASNAELGTPNDATTEELLAGVQRGNRQYYPGRSTALILLSNFVTMSSGTIDQKSAAIETMRSIVGALEAQAAVDDKVRNVPIKELTRSIGAVRATNTFIRKNDTQFQGVNTIDDHGLDAIVLRPSLAARAWGLLKAYPWLAAPMVGLLVAMSYFSTLLLFPLFLLRGDALMVSLSEARGSSFIDAIFGTLGVLITFNHSTYVQDAWVRRNAKNARSALDGEGLKSRHVFVALPIEIQKLSTDDARWFSTPSADSVRPFLNSRANRILISGEGGIGKSMLAYYLATLTVDEDPRVRLWPKQAIPLAISSDIEGSDLSTPDDFVNFLIARIASFADPATPVTSSLVRAMLGSKRIVLVIDGLTEMSDSGLSAINRALLSLPINAVILTSRSESVDAAGLRSIKVRPQRIKTPELESFLRPYVEHSGYGAIFTDERIAQICRTFSAVMGETTIPLFVTMYVDMVVAQSAEQTYTKTESPPSIPRIILTYVRYLNNKIAGTPVPTDEVVTAAKQLANVVVVKTHAYRPGTARVDEVRDIFSSAQIDRKLAYFESRLNLIRRPDELTGDLQFSIDSVCEYLAALYLLDLCKTDISGLAPLHDKLGTAEATALLAFLEYIEDCVKSDAYDGSARTQVLEDVQRLREECKV